MSFIQNMIKNIGDENTSVASEGISSAEYSGFTDTGSYILNAALSGTIHGGMPNNKILALAGPEAVGKTFFALGIARNFILKSSRCCSFLVAGRTSRHQKDA